MTTTIIVILLILVFFVALFYYTHREDDEIDSEVDKNTNDWPQPPTQLNGTAKSALTQAWNGVNGVRSQVSQTLSEIDMSNLPSLSQSGLDLKGLKMWPNGSASNGSGPSEMQNGQANENQEASSENKSIEASGGGHIPLAHRVSEALNGWNPLAKDDNQLAPPFKEWAASTHFAKRVKRIRESTRGMKSWLAELSAEESEILTKQVNQFASDLNFEFSWLLDKELDYDRELKRDIEEIIVLYCLATFKGLLLQDELNMFIMLQAWLENSTSKEYRELNQKLFTTLVERELAEGVPSDLLLADEEQRSQYAIQAINQVLQADRKTFLAILKEVLLATETEQTEQAEQEMVDQEQTNQIIDKAKELSPV